MANSVRYRALSARFRLLQKQFIPKKFSPTGMYSSRALDRARAFRVLVHAEIEHFFEDRAIEIADKAYNSWMKNGRTSKSLVSLLANFRGDAVGLPKKLGLKVSPSSQAAKCYAQFRYAVTHNHGIKTENLLGLFLPIGVDETSFDVTWLAVLDTFGTRRGAAAHSSGITYTIDPKAELSMVQDILAGIKTFDEALNVLRKSIR